MSKSVDTYGKKVWVPPPARSSKKGSSSIQSVHGSPKTSPNVKRKTVSLISEVTEHSPKEKKAFPKRKLETSNISCQTSFSDLCLPNGPEEIPEKLQDFQKFLKFLKLHSHSLKICTELLHKPIRVRPIDQTTLHNMVFQSSQHVNFFERALHEFEANISAIESGVDKDLKQNHKELSELCLLCQQSKDLTVVRLVKAYDNTTSALRFVYDVQLQGELTILQSDHDILKGRVEALKDQVSLRDSQQEQLEKKLALSQEELLSLQEQKRAAEDKNSRLVHELTHTNLVMDQLRVQTEAQELEIKSAEDKDQLVELMEELEERHKAEKEALKKALKAQKARLEQHEDSVTDLKSKLMEKERMSFNLATERDHWKMQLTAKSNSLIEAASQVEALQSKNAALQDQLNKAKTFHQDEIQLIQDDAGQKTSQLEESRRETERVHAVLKEESQTLISLLQDVKDQFVKKSDELMESNDNNAKNDETAQSLMQQLIETSKTFLLESSSKNQQLEAMKKQHNELETKMQRETEERLKLQKRCDDLETTLQNSRKHSRAISALNLYAAEQSCVKRSNLTYMADGNTSSDDVQLLKPSGNAGKLQVIDKRLKHMEEELEQKNQRISALESRNFEVERKHSSQIKDLQDKLERATSNNESMKKYVEILKSSYTNVFGK